MTIERREIAGRSDPASRRRARRGRRGRGDAVRARARRARCVRRTGARGSGTRSRPARPARAVGPRRVERRRTIPGDQHLAARRRHDPGDRLRERGRPPGISSVTSRSSVAAPLLRPRVTVRPRTPTAEMRTFRRDAPHWSPFWVKSAHLGSRVSSSRGEAPVGAVAPDGAVAPEGVEAAGGGAEPAEAVRCDVDSAAGGGVGSALASPGSSGPTPSSRSSCACSMSTSSGAPSIATAPS